MRTSRVWCCCFGPTVSAACVAVLALAVHGCAPSVCERPPIEAPRDLENVAVATAPTSANARPAGLACEPACGRGARCVAGACRRSRTLAIGASPCALARDGAVWCWGSAEGDTNPMPAKVSVRASVAGLHVVAGWYGSGGATCALGTDGSASCWSEKGPVDLKRAPPANTIDFAISDLRCALAASGTVSCSTGAEAWRPVVADGLALAENDTCVIRQNGGLVCLSASSRQSAGDGVRGDFVLGIDDAIDASSVRGATYVVRRGGELAELTRGTQGEALQLEAAVLGVKDAVQVSSYGEHACVLHRTGKVSCWGKGAHGELGNGHRASSATPVEVAGLDDVVEVGAGHGFSCAVVGSGATYCWGARAGGRMGDGYRNDHGKPVQVMGITDATHVVAGSDGSCALLRNGSVWCWGRARGDLREGRDRGVPPEPAPGIASAVALAGSCAVDAQGSVACFEPGLPVADVTSYGGMGPVIGVTGGFAVRSDGQLLRFERTTRAANAPAAHVTMPIAGVGAVATSYQLACALKANGRILCFTYDRYGKIDPTRPQVVRQTELAEISDALDMVEAGGSFCSRRGSTKTVWCWSGSDVARSLAPPAERGAKADASSPPPAPPPTVSPQEARLVELPWTLGSTRLAASYSTLCVITAGGDVRCSEPKGDALPRPAVGLSDVVDLSMGARHACAVDRKGLVFCWGSNDQDQLGIDEAPIAFRPVRVPIDSK
ncbi:MAG: hypothetical protein HY908_27265 [Myxococcales bacterium]|nr:hypothetical protein [Myxococcales bacterium]